MTHHAKASSAGSTEGGGNSRGFCRRAFAIRGARNGSKGSGAPSAGRLRAAFAVLALAIAAFAITAAPASAATSAEMGSISNVSYASAQVSGRISANPQFITTWSFQYCTAECSQPAAVWTTGAEGTIFGSEAIIQKFVSGNLVVPKGGTQYFVRLNVSAFPEEASSTAPYPSFTSLVVEPPTLPGAVGTSQIFSTSAIVAGKVKRPANADPAFDISACRFEYVTDAQFTATGFATANPIPCEPATPFTTPNGETNVTADITGLSPVTTYHLRLAAENAAPAAVTKEAAAPFTTSAKVTAPTVLATADATEVTQNTAKVSGEVQRPAGADPALDVNCRFEYVTDEHFTAEGFVGAEQTPCAQNPITAASANGEGKQAVSAELGDVIPSLGALIPAKTYHLRLAAENEGGVDTKEAAHTFITPPAALPDVTIDPVEGGTFTTAHVSGTVDFVHPEFSDIYAWLGWEISTDNVNWSIEVGNVNSPSAAGGIVNVSHDFTGLQPSTTYFFRLGASYYNNNGYQAALARGEVAHSPEPNPSITTEPAQPAPTATINPVSGITGTSAHLSGIVDPHAPAGPLSALAKKAYETEWHLECTPECKDANEHVIGGTIQGEEGAQPVAGDVKRLSPNSFYEVNLIVSNEGGGEAKTQTFQTPLIAPTVISSPGASDGQGGYFLEGIVNSNNTKITSCKFEYGTTATYPNTYEAPCLPNPSGPNEVQLVNVDATEGQFKLSFRGQTTADLPYNATPEEVQTALRALSQVGSTGVNVTGTAQAYKVTFAGSLAGTNVSPIKGSDGTTPLGGGAGFSASTETDGGNSQPVSIEAHLEALTVGSTYHFRIFATSAGGTVSTVDRSFIPELTQKENCANEQLRKENSSLALPECRAYEMVSPPVGKEGYDAIAGFGGAGVGLAPLSSTGPFDGGARVLYTSGAGNIAKSGQNFLHNSYVAERTASGWETIPDLNGSSGSLYDAPSNFEVDHGNGTLTAYSSDLLSSVFRLTRSDCGRTCQYRRNPDGTFAPIGSMVGTGGGGAGLPIAVAVSTDDLSHLVNASGPTQWGQGVYEFVGTGMGQPRRVDLDNSGAPISSCAGPGQGGVGINALNRSVSSDGSRIVNYVYGGCGGANPPAGEIWARVNGTTSFDVSASQCNRVACNAPSNPEFVDSTPDGSRVFFTTAQQLVNGDTDQGSDIYYCDIPSGNPAPTAGKANPCSAFSQISVAETGAAEVENVEATSDNGSTVLFIAKGVLAANEDALKDQAVAGDNNLYVWHQDAAHPAGQTLFVGRLAPKDPFGMGAQATPDGHYVVFTTANQLVETDTDHSLDVYRLDAGTGELTRVSTNVFGAGGNGPFDAGSPDSGAVSDDGQKIVFTTSEALSPLDGNGEPDAYLWTPGGVSLITTGSVGGGASASAIVSVGGGILVAIDGSGHDIYFQTRGALTPADGDNLVDVYDARIDGGFSSAPQPTCTGEGCQPGATPAPAEKAPSSARSGPGNPPPPKSCPKGKVKKHGKCVKKPNKKHHKKPHKKAGHNRGGSK